MGDKIILGVAKHRGSIARRHSIGKNRNWGGSRDEGHLIAKQLLQPVLLHVQMPVAEILRPTHTECFLQCGDGVAAMENCTNISLLKTCLA